MLRLCAFGGLRLEGPQGIVSGPAARPRPLAVLAVIAAAGPQGVTRERLVGLLWPDVPEDQARHALAQVLYALRKDLGLPDLLESSTSLVRLNRELIGSDVADAREALIKGDRAAALAVYAGPFADGFYLSQSPEFERWVEEERARWGGEIRRILQLDAAELERAGELHQAVDRWRRLVALDPLAAEPRLRLMRALEAAGDPVAALEEARLHAELLRRELDAPPPEGIVDLAHRLRAAMDQGAVPLPPAPRPALRAGRLLRVGTLAAAFVVVAAAVLSFAIARDDSPPVLAVGLLESHLPSDSLGMSRSLGDLLATHLTQVRGLPVIGRARLLEVLGTGGADAGPGALARAARTAGADELIEGVLYPDAAGYRLDLRRTRLRDGRARGAVSVTARDPIALVETAVAALAAHLGLGEPAAPLRAVTSVSLLARRFYEDGLRAAYAGNSSAASELFRRALEEDSTFAMAAFYLARHMSEAAAESAGGRWQRAVRLAERAGDRERLLILASGALTLNDARGLAFAETLAVRYPDDLDGIRILGDQRLSRSEFGLAMDAFERVMQLDAAGREGRSARCHACEAGEQAVWAAMMGDSLARAERIARRLVQWPAGRLTGTGLLVTVLLRQGRSDEAIAEARTPFARQAGVSAEAIELGLMLSGGELPALDSILERRLRAETDPAARRDLLGRLIQVRRESGRLRSALQLSRELASLIPPADARTAPFVHLERALTLLELGRTDAASARRAAVLFDSMAGMPAYDEPRMARHRAWMWTHQATALARAGDTASLAALETRIAAMAARSSYGRDRRLPAFVEGLRFEARSRWEEARQAYEGAVFSPTENLAAARLANAALRTGRAEEAIRVLEAYLRGPLDAANQYVPRWEVHALLAEAYTRAGRGDLAARHEAWVRRALAHADPEFGGIVGRP